MTDKRRFEILSNLIKQEMEREAELDYDSKYQEELVDLHCELWEVANLV